MAVERNIRNAACQKGNSDLTHVDFNLITEERFHINIFKLGGAYYFKPLFDAAKEFGGELPTQG